MKDRKVREVRVTVSTDPEIIEMVVSEVRKSLTFRFAGDVVFMDTRQPIPAPADCSEVQIVIGIK